ncbi:peroxisomal N(1)-acetyl-spermine/spermidine oxidase-like [Heptranchias perlo]|uniref:peroxisomal N(1)-acetyl-spermine/spermidine oxidase-like n=1 Tax=Heptranchias perlo TaxID=212740 RepID=UPI003559D539
MEKIPKIVIVGAGIAGVGVARKLLMYGFTEVQIIEASSQPGGRIGGSPFGKSFVDEGAQYIHGVSLKNPIFQLAKEHGLLQESPNELNSQWTVLTNTQDKLHPDLAEQISDLGVSIIQSTYSLAKGKKYAQANSICDIYLKEVKQLIEQWSSDPTDLITQKLSILGLVMKEQSVSIGTHDLGDVSVHSWDEYENLKDDLNFPGGMVALLQKLLEIIPREKLLLEKPVKQILWNGSFESEDGSLYPVRVVCEDGDHILADHVIVTVSLGHLKSKGQSLFHPPLPENKLLAIENIGFGTVDKIYLEYEIPFWGEDAQRIVLVWKDESPLSGLKPNLVEWWRRISHFEVLLPKERYGHVLLSWISGREAEFMEALNTEEVSSSITNVFRQFTGTPSLPQPKNILITKWFSNPFIRGSYSYMTVTSDGTMIDALAEPLPQADNGRSNQVLFAGEATHRNLYSTAQGALISGWREADRLIEYQSNSTCGK